MTLREVRIEDAAALRTVLCADDVAQFIEPPPATVHAFERYIRWALEQRAEGLSITFALLTQGSTAPVGLFHLRAMEPGFGVADWQFAIGSAFWGQGLFFTAGPLLLQFAFETIGVRRVEARAAVRNGRGNGALRKLGAVQEALLRQSLVRDGMALIRRWAILADDSAIARPGGVRTGALGGARHTTQGMGHTAVVAPSHLSHLVSAPFGRTLGPHLSHRAFPAPRTSLPHLAPSSCTPLQGRVGWATDRPPPMATTSWLDRIRDSSTGWGCLSRRGSSPSSWTTSIG